MLSKVVNFFTSLKLTVACLVLALGLVFIGTIAQVRLGLWIVQAQYFGSWFVMWGPQGASWKIPVFPGGYLIGTVLLVNLIAAHIKRFELSKKKFGIFVIHAGLILLLVGQLTTQLYQVESFMAIEEGGQKNYSESERTAELAIIDVTDTNDNFVVAIPQQILQKQNEIRHERLPFTVRVQKFSENSLPSIEQGKIKFTEKSLEVSMNKINIPAVTVEFVTDEGAKGPFSVSSWQTRKQFVQMMAEGFESSFDRSMIEPAKFSYKGREYEVTLRGRRYYKDFTLALHDFRFDRYMGTAIPKNFSSRVTLINPNTQENREINIYMNNPLRYGGETFYQSSFEPDESGTVLQVVRNPSWLVPYISCLMVSVGLIAQFMYHLVGFAKKRRA
ncbi:MAG TPA: cytochrome c biogenesis protein ResB [Verrucomicrobiae bacterium]